MNRNVRRFRVQRFDGEGVLAQRLIFPEKGRVALDDFAIESPDDHSVLVRTVCSLISTGTETTILQQKYDEGTHFAEMFSFPQLQTGNQAVGIIEEVGAAVEGLRPGQRVFFRKAHASHWTVPAALCACVPEGISTVEAVWNGFARIAFSSAAAAPLRLGGEVLIIGAGPVGQLAARWSLAAGMARTVMCDLSKERLSHAPRGVVSYACSVIESVKALRDLSTREGFQAIIDCTGNADAFSAALSLAPPLGKVILLGDTGFPGRQSLSSQMMKKSLSVIGAHEHQNCSELTSSAIDELFFELVLRGAMDLDGLVTHRFAPERYADAYALATDRNEGAVGILFDWSDE